MSTTTEMPFIAITDGQFQGLQFLDVERFMKQTDVCESKELQNSSKKEFFPPFPNFSDEEIEAFVERVESVWK